MKLKALGVVLLVASGVSACTTVDLSQVAIQSEPEQQVQSQQNVVERAALALTTKFRNNGWCSGGPQEKTQTATSVLLNGMQDASETGTREVTLIESNKLGHDLAEANEHVIQTTKAAEVYLSMSDDTSLDNELSLLETALLSAREAQGRFKIAVAKENNTNNKTKLDVLQNSVDSLKTVTDSYGDRIRSDIATQSSSSRS